MLWTCSWADDFWTLVQIFSTTLCWGLLWMRCFPVDWIYGEILPEYKLSSIQVFPRVVMCSMHIFGVSSSISKVSGMCTLPVNIVNEKIYVILWFAFLAHTLVSLLQLIRQAQLLKLLDVSSATHWDTWRRWFNFRQAALLMVSLRSWLTPGLTSTQTSPRQVRVTVEPFWAATVQLIDFKVRQLLVRGSYGDTVLLQLIAANCDSAQFAALVQLLVYLA